MKRNIYEILENTDEHQLEKLTENIEYDVPSDISAKNIEAKVFAKTGVAKPQKKLSRTFFIRFGAAAACFALLLCAYPAIKMLSQDGQEIIKETGSAGGGLFPEISTNEKNAAAFTEAAAENQMLYRYFYPSEDGSITSAVFKEVLTDGRSSETMQSHIERFFKLCGIKGITVLDSRVEDGSKTEYSDFGGETIVTHTPAKTLILTLEGEAELSEDVKKCLINTLSGLSYCKYFKVIYNGSAISIDGETPENGFTRFELNAEEITTPSALPGGFLTGALPISTDDTTPAYPSSSTEALPPYNPGEIAWETTTEALPPYIPETSAPYIPR